MIRSRLILLSSAVGLLLAACGSSDSTAGGDGGATAAATTACGANTRERATGTPIKIGAIMTSAPAADFKDGANGEEAFFDCVNDNGGIHGRPLQLIVENDQLDPAKAGAAATKLLDVDKVVAIAGGISVLDCPVNGQLYEERGYVALVGGILGDCFSSPSFAPVNMGPHYSAQGAAEAVLRAGANGTIVHVTGKTPGSTYYATSIKTLAAQEGLEFEDIYVDLPIRDGDSLARDLVNRAGEGGAVVITLTPPETLTLLEGAANQNLVDNVYWGAATSANDASLVEALDPVWNGKLLVNSELALLDATGPDIELFRAVMAKYGDSTPVNSFSQMGFLMGKILVDTLLGMDPDNITPETVNAALTAVANYKTDLLCKPWYVGDLPVHIANNTDRTVTPEDGKWVEKEGCFEITALDEALVGVRAAEASQDLNSG